MATLSRPQNAKELFNLRHSSLRNAVERIFGIVKKRFKMFREANDFPIKFQGQIATAICVLHNFIRTHDPEDIVDLDDAELEEVPRSRSALVQEPSVVGISACEAREAAERRDRIAEDMWVKYQAVLRSRGR